MCFFTYLVSVIFQENYTIVTPCCQECSCEPSCVQFKRCCPDAPYLPNEELIIPCISTFTHYNVNKNHSQTGHTSRYYRIVDHCPVEEKNTTLKQLCLQPDTFSDIAIVSGSSSGNVYGNKYCALCNDETDFVMWKLYLFSCPLVSEIRFQSFADRDKYIMEHCPIDVKPPTSYLQLTQLRMECVEYRPEMQQLGRICNSSDQVDAFNESVQLACEDFPEGYHALAVVALNLEEIDYLVPNIYCYVCNIPWNANSSEECVVQVDIERGGGKDNSLYSLIDFTMSHETSLTQCASYEMYDPYTVRVY